MYYLERLTTPALAVTVQEFKDEFQFNTTLEDSLISRKLMSAQLLFESLTSGRVVMPTNFRQHVSNADGGICKPVYLMAANVSAVSNFKYYDTSDALTTIDANDYVSDTFASPAPIYLKYLAISPLTSWSRRYPIYIEFTAGWTNANAVPDDVKGWIIASAGETFKRRELNVAGTIIQRIPQAMDIVNKYHTGIDFGNDWGN